MSYSKEFIQKKITLSEGKLNYWKTILNNKETKGEKVSCLSRYEKSIFCYRNERKLIMHLILNIIGIDNYINFLNGCDLKPIFKDKGDAYMLNSTYGINLHDKNIEALNEKIKNITNNLQKLIDEKLNDDKFFSKIFDVNVSYYIWGNPQYSSNHIAIRKKDNVRLKEEDWVKLVNIVDNYKLNKEVLDLRLSNFY